MQWCWYKADSLTLNDGDPIGTWADQSGNGNDLTATGNARPEYKINIVNGKPAARFVSLTNYMTSSGTLANDPLTLIAAVSFDNVANGGGLFAHQGAGNAYRYLWAGYDANTWRAWKGNSGSYDDIIGDSSQVTAQFLIWTLVIQSDGTGEFFINGATDGGNQITYDTNWEVGLGCDDYRGFDGDVAEAFVYDTALSDGDRATVESYLAGKYGITLISSSSSESSSSRSSSESSSSSSESSSSSSSSSESSSSSSESSSSSSESSSSSSSSESSSSPSSSESSSSSSSSESSSSSYSSESSSSSSSSSSESSSSSSSSESSSSSSSESSSSSSSSESSSSSSESSSSSSESSSSSSESSSSSSESSSSSSESSSSSSVDQTILIDNFSMGVEEWVPVIDLVLFAVDVIDHTYNITTSGTYFLHDGQIVPTSYSGIDSIGYKCYYYPSTISGAVSLTIHAENDNGETKEEDYYLLYGYNAEFEELIDWGPKKEIVVTMDAKNSAFCPNTESEAFYFETADLHSRDLNATLQAVEFVDLNAIIYPQSTAFFYSRTYKVTIEGIKDFAGNTMQSYEFEFTIEDPPN